MDGRIKNYGIAHGGIVASQGTQPSPPAIWFDSEKPRNTEKSGWKSLCFGSGEPCKG